MSNNGEVELYRRHRPTTFAGILGQPQAVSQLNAMGKGNAIPHALLLTGPSGCGKTTIARILRTKLKCGDADFTEVNAANARGIDDIRGIDSRMRLAPISGACRVWLIDEAHQISADGQSALLKMLEDTPRHVFFMLATTDPRKLKPTIITRCVQLQLKPLTAAVLAKLATDTATAEGKALDPEVAAKIAEVADGSARKALVILHQILGLADAEKQLAAVQAADAQAAGIDIARKLLDTRTSWPDMAAAIKNCEEEPETIRRIVIGYMSSVLLGGKKNARAFAVLQECVDPFYDSGKPGLTRAAYAVVARGE